VVTVIPPDGRLQDCFHFLHGEAVPGDLIPPNVEIQVVSPGHALGKNIPRPGHVFQDHLQMLSDPLNLF
jgi:hypothetical protein